MTCIVHDAGLAFGAGVSAVKAVTMLLSAGDHMVVSDDVYGGSTALWRNHTERTGITFTYVDARYTDHIAAAITPQTKVRTCALWTCGRVHCARAVLHSPLTRHQLTRLN